ncbi:hypothetical protein PV08_08201 [Exophiala spinifera]|uniref:MARVEL domain-containing protein n=1 Tax=Exophiala spinifera TaxID=91928 RepID=A0A0D2BPL8_9EURO|nr:uncharacterized protein PV08_08201 [Exophiala spinifera]KIW13014.1 hypothetical protein PV08_08201 [Exophiala spinifera]
MSQAAHGTDIVPMPRWSTAVGCARVALAVVVLALTAAATSIWGSYDAFGVTLFTASASLIIFVYYFIALSRQPNLYNRWAVLGLEIFGVIFWLTSFALMAQWTSVYNGWWYGNGNSYGFWDAPYRPEDVGFAKRTVVKRSVNKYHAGVALAGTAAGLGAVEFVLYTLTLTVFGMSLHQQRMSATPTNAPAVSVTDTSPDVEAGTRDKTPEPDTAAKTDDEPATV